MLNLAIECSGVAGSAALLQGTEVLVERLLPAGVGSVQSLAPAIADLLAQQRLSRVDLISVTHGPGSFTGLRSGLATAKMLAFAWEIPVVPVDTLAAIAFRIGRQQFSQRTSVHYGSPLITVVPVLNAFRKQVFSAAWQIAGSPTDPSQSLPCAIDNFGFRQLASSQVLDAAAWQDHPLHSLCFLTPRLLPSELERQVAIKQPAPELLEAAWIVGGPGLRSYLPHSACGASLADECLWEPTAGIVGNLGWQAYQAGLAVSAHELLPNYVRASAAEEQAAASSARNSRASP